MNKNNTPLETSKQVPFSDQRLCNYYKEKARYDLTSGIGINYTLYKQVCINEANHWVLLSGLVKANKAIGFPLVYGICEHSYGRTVYFEFFKDMKYRQLNLDQSYVSKDIMLQLVFILYSLYKHGIFSDNFKFELITIPRTTISISINHIIMMLTTDSLVMLSINTHLYKAELPQSCYLDYISSHKDIMERKHFLPTNYFFEWLIRNHFENISKQYLEVFKIKKQYINTSQINRLTEPGTLVYVVYNDTLIIGITLSEVSLNNIVRVIYSIDTGCIFEIDDFIISDIFFANELITRSIQTAINI